MVSASQAIAKAKATARWTVGMCDNFVANMYGYSSSGYNTAIDNWKSTPTSLRHPSDWNAPAGALMYWSGGRTGAGHVAISLGNGSIISTDATGPGAVGQISARTPSDQWGQTYQGWAFPYFQGQEATNQLGQWTGSTSATNAGYANGIQISAESVTSGFLGAVKVPFEMFLMTAVWIAETTMGAGMVVFAAILLSRG